MCFFRAPGFKKGAYDLALALGSHISMQFSERRPAQHDIWIGGESSGSRHSNARSPAVDHFRPHATGRTAVRLHPGHTQEQSHSEVITYASLLSRASVAAVRRKTSRRLTCWLRKRRLGGQMLAQRNAAILSRGFRRKMRSQLRGQLVAFVIPLRWRRSWQRRPRTLCWMLGVSGRAHKNRNTCPATSAVAQLPEGTPAGQLWECL